MSLFADESEEVHKNVEEPVYPPRRRVRGENLQKKKFYFIYMYKTNFIHVKICNYFDFENLATRVTLLHCECL